MSQINFFVVVYGMASSSQVRRSLDNFKALPFLKIIIIIKCCKGGWKINVNFNWILWFTLIHSESELHGNLWKYLKSSFPKLSNFEMHGLQLLRNSESWNLHILNLTRLKNTFLKWRILLGVLCIPRCNLRNETYSHCPQFFSSH